MKKFEGCYYGERKVVYVQIFTVDRLETKNLTVYGQNFRNVLKAVDMGLAASFGKVGSTRPKGRPKGRKKKKERRRRTQTF